LWESEVEAMYDAARRLSVTTAHLGALLGANGEPFAEELAKLEGQDKDVIDAIFDQAQKSVDLDDVEVRL
jgi:hypothetical protein